LARDPDFDGFPAFELRFRAVGFRFAPARDGRAGRLLPRFALRAGGLLDFFFIIIPP
jgi:hypothetical protein